MREKSTKKKIFSKKRIIAVVILFLLIVAMFFSNPEFQRFLKEPDDVKLDFQAGASYEPVAYGKGMLLVSGDGMRSVDSKGRENWNVIVTSSSPMVVVKNDHIMFADASGKTISVYDNDKILSQIETDNEILTAKMNKNGWVAAVTSERGYKGAVLVFDARGNEVFKWYSGNGYIGDIDLSADKKLAVAQLMTDKEKIYTRIMLIETDSENKSRQIAEVDGIIMKLKYKNDGGLIAVSDNGAYVFKKNGKEAFRIDFDGRIPVECNIENSGNMVFAFDSGLNNTILESYSSRGKLRGKYETDGKMLCMDVNGECILAATINGVAEVTPSGKEKGRVEVNRDIKKIKIFSGRDEFLSIGSGSAEIIKIR